MQTSQYSHTLYFTSSHYQSQCHCTFTIIWNIFLCISLQTNWLAHTVKSLTSWATRKALLMQRRTCRGRQTTSGKLSIVFYLYSPDGTTCPAQPTPYRLKIANFSHPLSLSAFVRGDPLRIYGKLILS